MLNRYRRSFGITFDLYKNMHKRGNPKERQPLTILRLRIESILLPKMVLSHFYLPFAILSIQEKERSMRLKNFFTILLLQLQPDII